MSHEAISNVNVLPRMNALGGRTLQCICSGNFNLECLFVSDSAPCSPSRPKPTRHLPKNCSTWSSSMCSFGVTDMLGKVAR